MKNIVLVLLFLLSIVKTQAQSVNDKLVYFDNEWKECIKDSATYYRIISDYKLKLDNYLVTDYYKDGSVQMVGNYEEPYLEIMHGNFTWFSADGTKTKEANYNRNVLLGKYKTWYNNGQEKVVGKYLKNKSNKNLLGQLKIYSYSSEVGEQKVKDGFGEYQYCDDKNKICTKGKIIKGFKSGMWFGYDKVTSLDYEEKYTKGELILGISTDSLGNKYYYKKIHIPPSPKDGLQDFYSYMKKKSRYPEQAIRKGVRQISVSC